MGGTTTQMIDTPYGQGRLYTRRARRPQATLLLSHGAGNGIDTHDLMALNDALPAQGITVVRFEQPWRVKGKPVATPPKSLDTALTLAANWMRVRTPLVVGGRSAGARSAVRTARGFGAAGALCLAFPLHPIAKPGISRAYELLESRVPTLVLQGTRDRFGKPEEFPEGIEVTPIPGADHSLVVGKRGPITQADADAILVESTLEWLVREVIV
ncbi:alpha/beta family hydrolase [Nocardioides sp. YR527]|uniref:alpha/beta hydrolase family protein n=1 Tax=Nocardioides sp. YR527 TaxID=1881028 RepID=UPI000B80F7CB|nr:alpha/beta family hydrolase [Nocardioides sp. YR527]